MATKPLTHLNLNQFCATVGITQKTARRWLLLGLVTGKQGATGRWKIPFSEAERVNRINGALIPSGRPQP